MDTQAVHVYLLDLQDRITTTASALDGGTFVIDAWEKSPTERPRGSGRTCILEGGVLLERGDVGFLHVMGNTLPPSTVANRPELAGRDFEAMGVSLVLHPRNPYASTVYMNMRCFVAVRSDTVPVWWSGSGTDLAPYCGFIEDASRFHRTCQGAFAPYGDELYPCFKQWYDDYFYLKHHKEARGIGGTFFDDFAGLGSKRSFEMMRSVGDAFLPAWLPIAEQRHATAYGECERAFQAYRRGRYIEFNLVFDRSTLFGLQSGGRMESVPMSIPPAANWRYDWQSEPGSSEAAPYTNFLSTCDWV